MRRRRARARRFWRTLSSYPEPQAFAARWSLERRFTAAMDPETRSPADVEREAFRRIRSARAALMETSDLVVDAAALRV